MTESSFSFDTLSAKGSTVFTVAEAIVADIIMQVNTNAYGQFKHCLIFVPHFIVLVGCV